MFRFGSVISSREEAGVRVSGREAAVFHGV